MSRLLRTLAVATVLVLTGTVAAWGGPLAPTTQKLGTGAAVVATCGSVTGATISYNARGSALVSVAVRNLPSTCEGARLSATASNAANADLGHGGPVTVVGATGTLVLSANPATSTVTGVRVVLVGP